MLLVVAACSSSDPSTPSGDAGSCTNAEDTSVAEAAADTATDTAPGDDAVVSDASESGSDAPADADAESGSDVGVESGVDAGDACDIPAPCPVVTDPTKAQLCGWIYDVADTTHVRSPAADDIEVAFYDPVLLASSTPTTRPAPMAKVVADACGRFTTVATGGIADPPGGVLAVVVDDKTGAPDDRVATMILVPWAAYRVNGLHAWSMRRTTDVAWSSAIASTPTIAARGALLEIFLETRSYPIDPLAGSPAPSVQITASGIVNPANDYYFADTAPLSRWTLSPSQNSTGANGSGLFLEPAFSTPYGGTGDMCTWPGKFASATADMLVVAELRASSCSP